MELTLKFVSLLSCFVFFQSTSGETALSTLTSAEADAIISQQAADKAKAEAEHIANSVTFNILERREVSMGERKLIANRVSDPQLPKISKPESVVAGSSGGSLPPEISSYVPREHHTLLLSATIYEGVPTVTHLIWRGNGQNALRYEAWSNIDWNFMRSVSNLKSDTDDYLIFQGIGYSSNEDEVPVLPPFTDGKAEYFVFADSATEIDDEAYEGIDLLHSFYEANEIELKVRYQRQEALNAAKERHQAANPEKPKNTVVHFWKSEDSN